MLSSCTSNASYAFDGITETPCPSDYPKKIQELLIKIDSTMDHLGHLAWTPGLYLAAEVGAKALTKLDEN